jgi:hypothetical protein
MTFNLHSVFTTIEKDAAKVEKVVAEALAVLAKGLAGFEHVNSVLTGDQGPRPIAPTPAVPVVPVPPPPSLGLAPTASSPSGLPVDGQRSTLDDLLAK